MQLLCVSLMAKMSVSTLNSFYFKYPAAFVNVANEKTYKHLSSFRLASVQLFMLLRIQQLTFHTQSVLVDTIVSLQGSDRDAIPVSEVH